MGAILKQAQQMQADMAKAQEELKDEVVDASAGGGMIKVKVSGDLNVQSIEIDPDGVLNPPADVSVVGWWKRSAKPGAATGQTLITGHTVHTGGGVMNKLGDLKAGDLIQVQTKAGTVDYRATRVTVFTKAQLAKHAKALFGQNRKKNRLVLVTCTGWTGYDYTSNIIVFADPLGVADYSADD